MNNFARDYEKILNTLQSVKPKMSFLHQIRQPKLSDIELIAIDLTSEYMGEVIVLRKKAGTMAISYMQYALLMVYSQTLI